ncbi:MAG: hypothetical protein AMJ81_07825 [Phycisphaerae bacterium SM23_33]|jgi:hypothetical protein|nr:MAG: hypothetical protein AMJ81_07825 [Phycisphaerae bacterium SM23_33]
MRGFAAREAGPVKRWALLVVVLYAIIISAALGATLMAAFWPVGLSEVTQILAGPFQGQDVLLPLRIILSGIALVMALAQVGLLVVPVRLAAGRPVTTRHIIWPILAGLFLAAVMIAAMCLAVWETLENTRGLDSWYWWGAYCAVGGVWLAWAFLFGFYTGARPPQTFMSRMVKFLLAGSVLELLVAVPTHVLARVRNYCCAGFLTFWGLAAGFSVMLVAFGPATFILFARRYASLQPRRPRPQRKALADDKEQPLTEAPK